MTFATDQETLAENLTLLRLRGRLDSVTSTEFEADILGAVGTGTAATIFDCTELSYVASAGLRVVLMAAKRAQQNGARLILSGLQPQVRDVFDISGFLKILETSTDIDGAKAQLAAG